MDQERLIRGISQYRILDCKDPVREEIFRKDIQPFIEDMINGVFLTLQIVRDEEFNKDLRQHLYERVIPGFEKERKGIRSIKNYLYITIRNETLNYLIAYNRRRKFIEKINQLVKDNEPEGGG